MTVTIGRATVRDACFIAGAMRAQDKREIDATTRFDSPAALACTILAYSGDFAFCAYVDGQPVTVFGVCPLNERVCSGWAFGTAGLKRTIPAITRFALNELVPELMARGFHRLEVRTIIDHDVSHKWLEGMGFAREGVLKAYGRKGQDFLLYAATRYEGN